MKPISEVLRLSSEFLQSKGIDRSRRIAEELLAASLGMKRMDLYLHFDRPVVEVELSLVRERIKKCAQGEPLEYVIGEVEFYNCKIAVDCRALIPRSETEILVDKICKKISKIPLEGKICWDVCTGSGCVGISLKKAMPSLDVTISDLSPEALDLASFNAKENGVDVSCVLGDLLEPFLGKKADFFVCNPPYITTNEYLNIQRSVKDFEPKLALVGGDQGTEFYERLSIELPPMLNSGALVFFEIGTGQGDRLKKIFSGGPWAFAEVEKDWAGHDRFFFLEKQ